MASMPIVAARDLREIGKRRAVAIHAVEAFDRDPGPAFPARRPPRADLVLERRRIVVRRLGEFRPARVHAVMGARMDERVVNHEIAALGQGREQGIVRGKAAAEIKRGFGAEKLRRLRLQRGMLGMVAAQQPGAARARRNATVQSLPDCRLQLGGVR